MLGTPRAGDSVRQRLVVSLQKHDIQLSVLVVPPVGGAIQSPGAKHRTLYEADYPGCPTEIAAIKIRR